MLHPEKVERDVNGFWFHSAVRDAEDVRPISELLGAEGMEFRHVSFGRDASEEMRQRYFESDDCNISEWTPTEPEGEGWFLLAIYDTEDGPYAYFARAKSLLSTEIERKMREQCLRPCPSCDGSGFVRDDYLFGAQMQARRVSAGVTLRVMASKTGLSVGYLSDLEHGRKKWRSGLILLYVDALCALRPALENARAEDTIPHPA